MGRRIAPVAAVLALASLAALPAGAPAFCTEVPYAVTTTADETNPSDGVLSLREAVAQADADAGGGHCEEIQLPAGHYTLTASAGGTLQIGSAANIFTVAAASQTARSSDVVIDGGGSVALFHVVSGATGVQFGRLTLTGAPHALVNDGTASLSQATVSANQVDGDGGAIVNTGSMQIQGSTFTGNRATAVTTARGGAIYNTGQLGLAQTTFVGNGVSAANAFGGAVYNGGTLTLQHSTFNQNTVPDQGGTGADVFNLSGKTAQTQDTIYGSGCNVVLTPVGAEGASLSSDGSCAPASGDLKLGPLQDNGGPTDTEMLLPGSPAIDAYTNQCIAYDQRGVTMPQGAKCDAGAYELVQTADLAVTADTGSISMTKGATATLGFHVASTAPAGDTKLVNDAVQPTLTVVLPAGLVFTGGSAGCAAAGQTVTCSPGPVGDNGAAVEVAIDVRADAVGTFATTMDAASPRPDTNAADDHATLTVAVTAPITPPPPQAVVALVGKPKVKGDRVTVVLACRGAPCSGDVAVLVGERLRRGVVTGLRRPAVTAAARSRTVSLAKKPFALASGARTTLTLRLSRAGQRLLKRFHRMPARLRVRLGGATAATAAVTFTRR